MNATPEDFQKSIIIPISKKATADKCDDFRTLILMAHVVKTLVKIICKRIENKIEEQLGYDQYGFRKNKGTRKAILSLKIPIEKQLELDKDTLIALEKAFGKVSWQKLFQILQ